MNNGENGGRPAIIITGLRKIIADQKAAPKLRMDAIYLLLFLENTLTWEQVESLRNNGTYRVEGKPNDPQNVLAAFEAKLKGGASAKG